MKKKVVYKVLLDCQEWVAFELAKEIAEQMNDGEYEDLETCVFETIDSYCIYYSSQWQILQAYCTPRTADLTEALSLLEQEIYEILCVVLEDE